VIGSFVPLSGRIAAAQVNEGLGGVEQTCQSPPDEWLPGPLRRRAAPAPPHPPQAASRQTHPACVRGAGARARRRCERSRPKGPTPVSRPLSPGCPLASRPCWSGPSQGWPGGPSPKATRNAPFTRLAEARH
jgi:hypothetical protein